MHDNKTKSTGSPIKPSLQFEETSDDTLTIIPSQSIVSSNWIPLKKQIEQHGLDQCKNVILDLSGTTTVDHSVLNNLQEMKNKFTKNGFFLKITLTSKNNQSKRSFVVSKKGLKAAKRITIFADASLQAMIEEELKNLGTTDFTSMSCVDLGAAINEKLRIEVLPEPDVATRITKYIQEKLLPEYAVRAYEEDV